MKLTIAAFSILSFLLSASMWGQTVKPMTFKQFIVSVPELPLWSAEALGHTMDWTSSQQGLRTPGIRETVMPNHFQSKIGMGLYEGSYVAAAPFVSYFFYKHRHRKIGYALQFVDAGVFIYAGFHNYGVLEEVKIGQR